MDDVEKEWLFVCNRWFDENQDDGRIEREILPFDEQRERNKQASPLKSPKSPRSTSDENLNKSVLKRHSMFFAFFE
jgi:hypothetical protein